MGIASRRQVKHDRGWDNPFVPFLIPRDWTLRAGPKVLAHYMPLFPRSFDDATPSQDYYAQNYLMPTIEGAGQSWATDHRPYGGWLRTRPKARAPIGAGYEALDVLWEITQAQEAAIDGFYIDILSTDTGSALTTRTKTVIAQASTNQRGFLVAPMVDASALGSGASASSVSDIIALFDQKSSTYSLSDGRLVVGIFAPEACPVSWFQSIASDYKNRYGKTIAWVGAFVNAAQAPTYASILYGAGQWGDMGDPASETSAPGYMTTIRSAGLKYLGACWGSSYRPKAAWYDEAVNTASLRAWWNRIIVDRPDFVQMTTWNDFTEGSGFMETVTQGRVQQDLSTYYLIKYKTGSFPAIIRDAIYLSHPTRTYKATILSPNQTSFMTKRASTTPESTCNAEAVVFLTSAATVTITISGQVSTFSGVQGVNVFSVPITTQVASGAITAKVIRGGVTVTTVTSTAAVRSSAWNDDHQCMMYSSLRGTAGQFDPTPQNDGTQPTYPAAANVQPPTNVHVAYTAGQDHALLQWDPPVSDGGYPITNYLLARDDGGGVETGPWSGSYPSSTRQLDFLYLKTGTYTLSVAAINAIGQSVSIPVTVTVQVTV